MKGVAVEIKCVLFQEFEHSAPVERGVLVPEVSRQEKVPCLSLLLVHLIHSVSVLGRGCLTACKGRLKKSLPIYPGELKTTEVFGTCPEVETGFPEPSFTCVIA